MSGELHKKVVDLGVATDPIIILLIKSCQNATCTQISENLVWPSDITNYVCQNIGLLAYSLHIWEPLQSFLIQLIKAKICRDAVKQEWIRDQQ